MTPDKVEAALARLYATAYGKGHHDTVEGGYVDVHYSDLDTYFADNESVREALSVLTEAMAERERDAARYRHLFDCAEPFCYRGDVYPNKEAADAVIDAAMKETP